MPEKKISRYEEIMLRLEQLQRDCDKGKVDTKQVNAITGTARAWFGGVRLALNIRKDSNPYVKKLIEGDMAK